MDENNTAEFSEHEQEQLRELVIKHRRGEIDDNGFRNASQKILAGRDFPILVAPPENATRILKKDQQESSNNLGSMSRLTTCGERSKKARRRIIRRQEQQKRCSFVAKAIAIDEMKPPESEGTTLISGSSINDSLILEDNFTRDTLGTLQMTESKIYDANETETKHYFLAFVSMMGTLCLTLLIAYSGSIDELIEKARSGELLTSHQSKDVSKINLRLEPIFGPLAVKQCQASCSEKKIATTEICDSACSNLSLENFATRITRKNLTPESYVDKINKKCSLERHALEPSSKEEWASSLNLAIGRLNSEELQSIRKNFQVLNKTYAKLLYQHGALTLPISKTPEESELTEEISSALCVKTNHALAKLGTVIAKTQKDHYSNGFYRRIEAGLSNRLSERNNKIAQLLNQSGYSK